MEKVYHLGMEETLAVIGGKWKPIILCHLGYHPLRTSELKKRIPSVTQKMLTQQLRELEADNIISREVFNQVPPKVIYALTEEGKTLRSILIAMSEWGENRIKEKQKSGEKVKLISPEHEGFIQM